MHYPSAVSTLELAFAAPLPGVAAQHRLAPRPTRPWPPGMDPAAARRAAGLLLMFPVDGLARIVLTVRAATLEHHGGQLSLPGGAIEAGESVEQAALREAHEEIGLDTAHVRLVGALTPVDVHVSGFRLYPLVGVSLERPVLTPSAREVSRLIEVGVSDLMNPSALVWRSVTRAGLPLLVPTVVIPGECGHDELWGATAMVVAEFLTLLGWSGPSARSPE